MQGDRNGPPIFLFSGPGSANLDSSIRASCVDMRISEGIVDSRFGVVDAKNRVWRILCAAQ